MASTENIISTIEAVKKLSILAHTPGHTSYHFLQSSSDILVQSLPSVSAYNNLKFHLIQSDASPMSSQTKV